MVDILMQFLMNDDVLMSPFLNKTLYRPPLLQGCITTVQIMCLLSLIWQKNASMADASNVRHPRPAPAGHPPVSSLLPEPLSTIGLVEQGSIVVCVLLTAYID